MSFRGTVTTRWEGEKWKEAFKAEMIGGYMRSAERIRDTARSLVHRKSGDLYLTIRAGRSEAQHAAFVFAGNRRDRIFYAHFEEFGTYDNPAHPFMRPAVDSNFNATKAEAARTGKRILNEERRGQRSLFRRFSKASWWTA